jgi:hypothetical protein
MGTQKLDLLDQCNRILQYTLYGLYDSATKQVLIIRNDNKTDTLIGK